MIMFLLTPQSARTLVNCLVGDHTAGVEEFSQMELSGMEEIGNILCSSYLGALGTLINRKVRPAKPMVTLDMSAAILSVPAIQFGIMSDKVLFIDSTFETSAEHVPGYFLLVPDMNSLTTILTSLGVM
jgi:chemotaxis protein CheC